MDIVLLLEILTVVVAGLLVGMEFSGWAVVHRTLNRIPFQANRLAEQAIYRGYGRIMPLFMPVTVVLVVVLLAVAANRGGPSFVALLVSLVGFLAMLAITLLGNVPINRRIESATSDVAPEEWWALRRRWDALHRWRVPVELLALSALVAGVALPA